MDITLDQRFQIKRNVDLVFLRELHIPEGLALAAVAVAAYNAFFLHGIYVGKQPVIKRPVPTAVYNYYHAGVRCVAVYGTACFDELLLLQEPQNLGCAFAADKGDDIGVLGRLQIFLPRCFFRRDTRVSFFSA